MKARGRLTGRFSRSMGGHLANTGKHGGIIEYYESCREYIGKYFLWFERIWSGYAIWRISAFDVVEKIFVLNGYIGKK